MNDEGEIWLHGLKFNYDEVGKDDSWILFKASVIHLSAHVAVTDFSIYSYFRRSKQDALANFVMSLIEDIRVSHFLKKLWPGVMTAISTANYICNSRLKKGPGLGSPLRVSASDLLSAIISDNLEVQGKIGNVTRTVLSALNDLKKNTQSRKTPYLVDSDQTFILNIAEICYSTMEPLGKIFETPALPYAESYGRNTLFTPSPSTRDQAVVAKVGEDDAAQVWREWESLTDAENGLIKQHEVALEGSRLKGIVFPRYDIVEYQRQRDDLSGTIARIGSQLAGMSNVYQEEGQQKSGILDLPEAVAAIAGGKEVEEVFIREELGGRSESISILIDMSKSLYSSRIPAHKSGIVLAEVANRIMITPNTWSMFGYNDRFYILKDSQENFGKRIKARIGGIQQGGITLTPDALRLAANALAEEIADMKTIILVTDGLVTGYSTIDADLKETVLKLSKTGINVIAIGIQSRRVRSFAKYATTVNSPYDLAKQFVGTYSALQSQN